MKKRLARIHPKTVMCRRARCVGRTSQPERSCNALAGLIVYIVLVTCFCMHRIPLIIVYCELYGVRWPSLVLIITIPSKKCTDMPRPLPCIAYMHRYLQPTRTPRTRPQKDNKSGVQIFPRRIDFSSLSYQVLLSTCLCIKARRTELHSWLFDKEPSSCLC